MGEARKKRTIEWMEKRVDEAVKDGLDALMSRGLATSHDKGESPQALFGVEKSTPNKPKKENDKT